MKVGGGKLLMANIFRSQDE